MAEKYLHVAEKYTVTLWQKQNDAVAVSSINNIIIIIAVRGINDENDEEGKRIGLYCRFNVWSRNIVAMMMHLTRIY